jgi:uncharacterized protein
MALRRLALAGFAVVASLGTAFADCVGSNLIDALPDDVHAALVSQSQAQPFASGNFWRAKRGDQVIHLIGTYHANDPRHDAVLTAMTPLISTATTLLVEAGPDEERALMDRMGSDPGVMLITEGPTLPELLPDPEWQALSRAMTERGIPPFMAAKFRPWYVSMMLSIPACGMAALAERGLDGLVMDAAKSANVPIKALEPYDTVFGIFGDMTMEDQVSMIRATMATEGQSEDFSVTLADTYFAEDSRLIWEFMHYQALQMPGQSPDQVNAEFARMEDAMMVRRNRAWIPVIEEAVANGPVFAAFGALHLSGKDGVLNLLQDAGFTLERLDLP